MTADESARNIDSTNDFSRTAYCCTAFEGTRRVAAGDSAHVAGVVKALLDTDETLGFLIFDDATGRQVEIDLRGHQAENPGMPVVSKSAGGHESEAQRGPGRPRLGVVAREVTLLPRHWEWLSDQPGGASVALRKLVDEARRVNADKDRARKSRDRAFKFMSSIAGDMPGFEEAVRALYAGKAQKFEQMMAEWPPDVREYALKMAEGSWQ